MWSDVSSSELLTHSSVFLPLVVNPPQTDLQVSTLSPIPTPSPALKLVLWHRQEGVSHLGTPKTLPSNSLFAWCRPHFRKRFEESLGTQTVILLSALLGRSVRHSFSFSITDKRCYVIVRFFFFLLLLFSVIISLRDNSKKILRRHLKWPP